MYTQFSLSDLQKRQVTLDSCNRWSSKRSVADKGDVPENSAVGVRELSLHKSVGSESSPEHPPPPQHPPLSSCVLTNVQQSAA